MKTDLTQERVRELFDYDEESGILDRKFKSGKRKPVGNKPNSAGYGKVKIDKKTYLTHRIIWLWMYGSLPEFIDHINRDKMDNRIENLREVSKSENQHNHGLRRDNSSGFPGVSWHKRSKKYIAQIAVDSKLIYLGLFNTAEDAFLVYQLAKIKFHPTNPIIQQLSPEGISQSKIINNEKGLNFE